MYVVADPVRGLLDRKRSEEHLQSSNKSKIKNKNKKHNETKQKRQKERINNKIHMSQKDRRRALDRESLV